MNSSDQNPALPTWIFIATDATLICVAAFIALRSPHPLPASSIMWIVACVGLGVAVGLVPLVLRYERQKNEYLDARQRELETLAESIGGAVGQVSLAANALQDIADLAHRNLRMAEHLPHKLQDKIAEFQSQLSATTDVEKEELEKELLALRTSESERLESVSQRIAKSTAEWARLETVSQQHLAAANETVARLASDTAGAIGRAQAAAEQALSEAKAATLAEIDARLSAATDALIARVTAELGVPAKAGAPAAVAAPHPPAAGNGGAGKRPEPAAAPAEAGGRTTAPPPATPPAPPPAVADEPVPVPARAIPEITPVAPPTAEPFPEHLATTQNGGSSADPGDATKGSPEAAAQPAASKPARKRGARKHEGENEPALGLDLEEAPAGFTSGVSESVRTSDGATRLLVTAYIGIGNRLYIRGEGPGLSWEKGTPLHFVSIGKWRWETNDASAPVPYKLYKNDEVECAALGKQTLNPGQQQELLAAF